MRLTEMTGNENGNVKVELVEKASGKVVVDLGNTYGAHLAGTILVWSADSKWLAHGTRSTKVGDTSVYFWNGSAFESVSLPENLPGPSIRFDKGAGADVKNYGGAVAPVRWLKSGQLELSSDSMMLSRVNDKTYTGTVRFTVGFDSQHHASVRKVGKSTTKVE
jgi:hypothetical protein